MGRQEQQKNFREQKRKQLHEILAVDSDQGWMNGAGSKFSSDTTARGRARPDYQKEAGGLRLKYGVAPNDSQLDQWIKQNGGYPSGTNKGLMNNKPGSTSNRKHQVSKAAELSKVKAAKTDLEKFFESAEKKVLEANDANRKRRDTILKDLDDRYNRVMDRIGNFGVAARADLQERSAEALGNIQANLSARGLGNSTIMASFMQRNQRDLAREQQRVSEMVDTRAMNADMKMTSEKTGFLERINENAPDYNQLMNLAAKYGEGNAGQGFNAGGQQQGGLAQGAVNTNIDNRQQGGGFFPGAVAAGSNRGPIFAGDMGVGNFLNSMPQFTQDPRGGSATGGSGHSGRAAPTVAPQKDGPAFGPENGPGKAPWEFGATNPQEGPFFGPEKKPPNELTIERMMNTFQNGYGYYDKSDAEYGGEMGGRSVQRPFPGTTGYGVPDNTTGQSENDRWTPQQQPAFPNKPVLNAPTGPMPVKPAPTPITDMYSNGADAVQGAINRNAPDMRALGGDLVDEINRPAVQRVLPPMAPGTNGFQNFQDWEARNALPYELSPKPVLKNPRSAYDPNRQPAQVRWAGSAYQDPSLEENYRRYRELEKKWGQPGMANVPNYNPPSTTIQQYNPNPNVYDFGGY